jgi:uncharacterized membrane protein
MACTIIEGVTLDCRQGAGGIKKLYLTEFANVSSITSSSGSVSAITMVAGKKFWTVEVELEDAQFDENATVSIENGTTFYEQSLTFSVYKMTAKNRNIVRLLTQNRLMVIVQDADDVYHLAGETRAMHLTTGTSSTGKAMGDKNGYSITLTGKEPLPSNKVNSGVISGII